MFVCPILCCSRSAVAPQRRSVLDAASIAGLNVLRTMNETAAAALCWGLPKSLEFPDDSAAPRHALFFDMGHSSTQVRMTPRSHFSLPSTLLRPPSTLWLASPCRLPWLACPCPPVGSSLSLAFSIRRRLVVLTVWRCRFAL